MSRTKIASWWRARSTRVRIALCALCMLCILVCISSALYMRHVSQMPRVGTPSVLRDEFIKDIRARGGAKAYQTFIDTYEPKALDVQHNAAHLFGEALYDVLGVSGIAQCTQQFNFGCFHGFISRTIATEGLEVVAKLDEVCRTKTALPAACQHGIGHGILEFLGHKKLVQALEACGLTVQPDPIAGCTSGVFMEYNVPLIIKENLSISVDARPLEHPDAPLDVCPSLPERYRISCYHELPQWWNQVYTTQVPNMVSACGSIADDNGKRSCYAGVANIIASKAGYRAEPVVSMCEAMPNPRQVNECYITVSWTLLRNFNLKDAALAVCAHVGSEFRDRCPT